MCTIVVVRHMVATGFVRLILWQLSLITKVEQYQCIKTLLAYNHVYCTFCLYMYAFQEHVVNFLQIPLLKTRLHPCTVRALLVVG